MAISGAARKTKSRATSISLPFLAAWPSFSLLSWIIEGYMVRIAKAMMRFFMSPLFAVIHGCSARPARKPASIAATVYSRKRFLRYAANSFTPMLNNRSILNKRSIKGFLLNRCTTSISGPTPHLY